MNFPVLFVIVLAGAAPASEEWGEPVTFVQAVENPTVSGIVIDGHRRLWGLVKNTDIKDVPAREELPEPKNPEGHICVSWLCSWEQDAWRIALIGGLGERLTSFSRGFVEGPDGSQCLWEPGALVQLRGLRARRLSLPQERPSIGYICFDAANKPWFSSYDTRQLMIDADPNREPAFTYDASTEHGKMLDMVLCPSHGVFSPFMDSAGRFWVNATQLGEAAHMPPHFITIIDPKHKTPRNVAPAPDEFRRKFLVTVVDSERVIFQSPPDDEAIYDKEPFPTNLAIIDNNTFLLSLPRKGGHWEIDATSFQGRRVQVENRPEHLALMQRIFKVGGQLYGTAYNDVWRKQGDKWAFVQGLPDPGEDTSLWLADLRDSIWIVKGSSFGCFDATGHFKAIDWPAHMSDAAPRRLFKESDDSIVCVAKNGQVASYSKTALASMPSDTRRWERLRPDSHLVQDSKRNIYTIKNETRSLAVWNGANWQDVPLPGDCPDCLLISSKTLFADSEDKVWVVGLCDQNPAAVYNTRSSAWAISPRLTEAVAAESAKNLTYQPAGAHYVPLVAPDGTVAFRTPSSIRIYFDHIWHTCDIRQIINDNDQDASLFLSKQNKLRFGSARQQIEFSEQTGWSRVAPEELKPQDHAAVAPPAALTSANDDLGRVWYFTHRCEVYRRGFAKDYLVAKDIPLSSPETDPNNHDPFSLKLEEVLIDPLDNAFLRFTGPRPDYLHVYSVSPLPSVEVKHCDVSEDRAIVTVDSPIPCAWSRCVDNGPWSTLLTGDKIKVLNLPTGKHTIGIRAVDPQTLRANPRAAAVEVEIAPPAPQQVQAHQIDDAVVRQAIQDLASPDFGIRENAVKTLVSEGKPVLPALRAARPQSGEATWWFDTVIQHIERRNASE